MTSLRRFVAVHAAAIATALSTGAGVARGDVMIDDFDASFFIAIESAIAPFHEVQNVVIDGSPAVRTGSALSFFSDPGSISFRVTNANGFEFIPTGTPGGARMTLSWFGATVPDYPAEGPGSVTTDDVEPFDPILDLGGETCIEIDAELIAGAATIQLFAYDPLVDNTILDQSANIPLVSGAQTISIDFASFFSDVDPAAVGGLGLVIVTASDGHVALTRVEAVGNACVADFDGGGTVGFSDLNTLLTAWGPCPAPCAPDLDGSGAVGFADLNTLLTAWGACP